MRAILALLLAIASPLQPYHARQSYVCRAW